MEHYRFEAAFCNVNARHEKGNVEGKVGYHRRNMLVPIPRFQKLKEFNKDLLKQCEQDSARDHYRKEGTIKDVSMHVLPITESQVTVLFHSSHQPKYNRGCL